MHWAAFGVHCGAGKRQEGRGLAASQTAMGTSEPQTNGHQNPDLQNLRNSSSESLTPSSKDAAHNAPQQQDRSQQAQSQGTQQSGQGQQDAQASRQVVDALFAVLQQPLLPSTCLWQVGWLLSQLLAHAQSGASQLAPQHQKQLDQVGTLPCLPGLALPCLAPPALALPLPCLPHSCIAPALPLPCLPLPACLACLVCPAPPCPAFPCPCHALARPWQALPCLTAQRSAAPACHLSQCLLLGPYLHTHCLYANERVCPKTC